ncbi:hypothetical protein D3C75_1192830 [compost metagenome]
MGATDDILLGLEVERSPFGDLVAQADLGIQGIVGHAVQRFTDFTVGEELDPLADQVTVVVPLHGQGIEVVLATIGIFIVGTVDQ